MTTHTICLIRCLLALPLLAAGCSKKSEPTVAADAPVAKHEHHPPHGGTPVVLGEEAAHVELVLDAAAGRLQAYVLDGELENFIRVADPALEIVAGFGGATRTLTLQAVPNPATGETVGATSLFAGEAEWLKTTPHYQAKLTSITVKGKTYREVAFSFPEGNDHD